MSGLAELERAKRRRLQEAYADLRPSGASDGDRQAKLRNLLLGAAADAGLQPPSATRGSSGSPCGHQAVRALAAAAAATITAVEAATPKRKGLGGGSGSSPGGHVYGGSATSGGGSRRRCLDAAVRAPPPGPMDGGFLQEVDPIQRLSRLGQVPPAGPYAAGGGGGAAFAANPAIGVRGNVVGGAGAAAAVVVQRYDAYDGDDNDDAEAEVPSDVELALMAIKSELRSHPPSTHLPPLALRSQLSSLLVDRSTVERQLDEQRRSNRVRVFKLPTGTDEFGILTTSDYRATVRQAADEAASAAAAAATAAAAAPQQGPAMSSGAYGTPSAQRGVGTGGGSRWHLAAEAYMLRVVDRYTDFELSRDHLLHLLRATPSPQPTANRQPQQQPPRGGGQQPLAAAGVQQQGRHHGSQQRDGAAGPDAAAAAGAAETPPEVVEEQVSLLLHLGCIARHTDGDADAYVLAVPGAGKLVKAVLGGRRELLTWLSKRQNQEAPEEQICKLKLRSSCLPPMYHVRELVGRGGVKRLDSTCGTMIRMPRGKRPG